MEFLADMTEAMLPTFSGKLALRMVFRIDADYFGKNDGIDTPGLVDYIEMLIHRPTNYTKIYIRTNSDFKKEFPDVWTKVSDHDSCWRNDGFNALSKRQYELSQQLANKRKVATNKISCSIYFDIFDGKPTYITIEEATAQDKAAIFPKTYLIKKGPQVPLKEIHKHLR